MRIPPNSRPLIVGCEGYQLTEKEKKFLANTNHPPMGVILFTRNCENQQQLKNLTQEIKECLGWNAPIMIDQEGGYPQRLYQDPDAMVIGEARAKPRTKENIDEWPPFPSVNKVGGLFSINPIQGMEASYWMGLALATQLYELGITVNLAPNLDLYERKSHKVIRNRTFHKNSFATASLGGHMIQGHLDSGILPTIKHLPGHGKAINDSHYDLPIINQEKENLFFEDLYPFHLNSECPLAMLAHIQYPQLDDLPATQSSKIINLLKNQVGINGILITDCIFMEALNGSLVERAKNCHQAGMDIILSSHGSAEENEAVCKSLPPINEEIKHKYIQFSRKAAQSREYALEYGKLPLSDYLRIYQLFKAKLIPI